MALWLKIVLAVVLVLALIAVFVITYLINKKTKAPEGCPKAEIGCAGCLLNCGRREEEAKISVIADNLVNNFKSEKEKEAEEASKEENKEDKK